MQLVCVSVVPFGVDGSATAVVRWQMQFPPAADVVSWFYGGERRVFLLDGEVLSPP